MAENGARRWAPALAAGVLLAVLVACGVGGYLYFRPRLSDQYPASLDTPAEAAGLTLSTDPGLADAAAQMAASMRAELRQGAPIAAVYLDPAAAERTVVVWGGTALLRDPAAELEAAFQAAADGGFAATEVREVPAGPPGGVARCGLSRLDNDELTLCGWADHGSLVMMVFFARDPAASAALLPELRAALRST